MECLRCGGSGKILKVKHVQGGMCFDCNGKGYTLAKNEIKVDFKRGGKIIATIFCTTETTKSEVRAMGIELGATTMKLTKGASV